MRRTFVPKLADIRRDWVVVDAAGLSLGRLSSFVAHRLMGKHKAGWVPYQDTGDFVVVVNADQTVLTGNKEKQKVYYHHTGRPGSLRQETAQDLRQRRPEQLVERAVKGMLPKSRLGRKLFRKLKVYVGPEHPHQAQQPVAVDVAGTRRAVS